MKILAHFPFNNCAFWVLVLLTFVLVFYTVERILYLHSNKVKPQQFLNGIISLLRNKRYREALSVCESSPGAVPSIVKVAITFREKTREELIPIISVAAALKIPLLERRLNSIKLMAKIAPGISFIGSIHILTKILAAIKITETYFDASLAISFLRCSAILVAFALTINILGELTFSLLRGRVRRLIHDMEWSSYEILNFIDSSRQ